MKALLVALACALLLACAVRPQATAGVGQMRGDTTLAAGGSFKIYPFFTLGGGHIHSPQWVLTMAGEYNNGFSRASSGFVFGRTTDLRIVVWGGSGVDTSGATSPAGQNYSITCSWDSILVLDVGGAGGKVTFGGDR